jgi:hypothetical protein
MVLTLVSHLTARPAISTSTQAALGPLPSGSTLSPAAAPSLRKPAAKAKPANPLEVVLGPTSIGGQFTVLAANRITVTPTSDNLRLHLRVVSRAMADLVTPLQYVALEIHAPGHDPIAQQRPFSHPLPAGNTWDDEVVFTIPASLSLDGAALRIYFYNEQKDISLRPVILPHGGL